MNTRDKFAHESGHYPANVQAAMDHTTRPPGQHSPLPWKSNRNANGEMCVWTTRPATNILAKLYNIPHETTVDANAAYIVKACNEYPKLKTTEQTWANRLALTLKERDEAMAQRDELLAALKAVSIRDFNAKNDYGISSDTMHQVRAAIANAEKSNG